MAAAVQITTISLNIADIAPMVDQFCELVKRLGIDEAQRRIGRPIDEAYLEELIITESGGDTTSLTLTPSPEFRRAIAVLSGAPALSHAIDVLSVKR